MKRIFNPGDRQSGAVLVLAGITMAVLIGFLGIVIDLGRLFVTKTELQSAMDACSLAASAELQKDVQAVSRAVSAGITAGTRNRVGFQSATATITAADIYFSDRLSNNSTTFPFGYVASAMANPATAEYAMCAQSVNGITSWFMQVLQGFLGQAPSTSSVGAWAVATLQPAQISCAIPIGMCKLPAGTASDPFAGMVKGQWMTSKLSESATGSFDWIDFTPPGGGASELADLLKGSGACNLPPAGGTCPGSPGCVGEQGTITSLDMAWNTRFGLYKGSASITTATPDHTGYAYTPLNWPSKFNAYGGTTAGVPNYTSAWSSHLPYQGDASTGLGGPPGSGTNSYSNSTSTALATKGAGRRVTTVPVVDCGAWAASNPQTVPVLGYACGLLLHPLTQSAPEVWLEYLGKANDPSTPCATSGLGGGTTGPLVPVLVH